jgi:AcrR family transcriptional regulator
MRGIPTRGRGLSRRQTSEKALVDAFEALLERHGPGGVGVNAVLDSARVGKRLLYEYFGDLEGLATAWSRERRDPLAIEGRRPALQRRLAALPPLQAITEALADYAHELRRHPWAAQVLLAELAQPATLGRAMREIRRELGKDYEGVLVESAAFASQEAAQVGFILHAAATYLAMRARFAPDYNGIDLASPQGWKAAMDAFAAVADFGAGGVPGKAGRSAPAATRRSAPRRAPAKPRLSRKPAGAVAPANPDGSRGRKR